MNWLHAFSIIGFLLGFLNIAGGAMSDAPMQGQQAASFGAVLCLASIAAFVLACVGAHNGWFS